MSPPPSPVELLNGGGFSSPTTPLPQSSFRELDDAFLQNQTRIWLGEVLNMRFDKDMNISDLLADGQILFGVYKVFRKMLLGEDHSSRQKFLEKESVSSSEITEIFPYAKVESFLEICQSLGLADIDLITTSDVVDKRNTRKVCMCLRSLSRKARSRNLNVPDFDIVIHRKKSPATMPTDMVGNRRRNLERSSSSPVPDTVSSDTRKGSRMSQQGEFVDFQADSSANKSDDDHDDCESGSVVGDSMVGSTDSSADSTSPRTPDPSVVQDFSFVQREIQELNIEGPNADEYTSPSQGVESGVGDNFQLIDHQSNYGNGNNLPIHCPLPFDCEDGNNVVEFDDTNESSLHSAIDASSAVTAHTETESNELEVTSTNDVDGDGESMISPSNESGKNSHGVDLICENCRDIPCIEDMKNMNNPSNPNCRENEAVANGCLGNYGDAKLRCHVDANDLTTHIEDADKDESEDLKDENKKVALQSKPPRKMLKLIAGGTGTVAAMGLLLFWLQLRKKGTENVGSQKLSLPNPIRVVATENRSSRNKQERAATNKVYPANKLNFGS